MQRLKSRVTAAVLAAAMGAVALDCVAQERARRRRPDDPRPEEKTPEISTRIRTLVEDGGRLDWSHRNNTIVFDRRGSNGFEIYTISPSGTDEKCLTCGAKGLDTKSRGNPAWHPSGDYIVFQGQNDYRGLARFGRAMGRITDYFANPGSGINNDVWLMDRNARKFWRLTTVEPRVGGVLHPHFSPDGDKLFWSERISTKGPWGEWALKVADFRMTSEGPRLSNVRREQPGSQQRMFEAHGFTRDGEEILFSGNLEPGQGETGADVYLYDLKTGALKNLTKTKVQWDEHAQISPDGETIVWMSSKDLPDPKYMREVRTDYWLMDIDGSNKRRLTYFNTEGHPEYIEKGATAADCAWGPDGKRIAAYLITDVKKGGTIVMIDILDSRR